MISQIAGAITLTQAEENHIAKIPHLKKPLAWDSKQPIILHIRESIFRQLNVLQNEKCCYCGLQLWETARGEVDHIAPKNARKKPYPQFTFEKQNLAISCEYCNGSSKKGETDTVLRENPVYANCEFKIVHPYFDNPANHYEWINSRTQVTIGHKSWKGLYSIILFELNTERQANARGKQRIYERKVNRLRPLINILKRFKQIVTFKPNP